MSPERLRRRLDAAEASAAPTVRTEAPFPGTVPQPSPVVQPASDAADFDIPALRRLLRDYALFQCGTALPDTECGRRRSRSRHSVGPRPGMALRCREGSNNSQRSVRSVRSVRYTLRGAAARVRIDPPLSRSGAAALFVWSPQGEPICPTGLPTPIFFGGGVNAPEHGIEETALGRAPAAVFNYVCRCAH